MVPGPSANQTLYGAEVLYSYYPFLSADTIYQLDQEELQFLETLGCYRVPARASLDEFIKAYFLYIHPLQPLLDEAEFWRAYSTPSSCSTKPISIFVFQAMLFAACSFVPFSTIQRLGFSNYYAARATFYRRAKSLFHVDSGRDALSSAQGALLLTYYVSASDAKVNSLWLSNAIYFARTLNAMHRHHERKKDGIQQWTPLERLWRCCLLRDRVLALGLHRPMQIGVEEGHISIFQEIDPNAGNEGSKSRDSAARRAPPRTSSAFSELVNLLGPALGVLGLDPSRPASGEQTATTDTVRVYSEQLDEWYERVQASRHIGASTDKTAVLQNNILYICYHAATLALWNQAIYASVVNACPIHADLSEGRKKVEAAIHGIDACLQQIAEHDMLPFMPITLSAYIVKPLVWHILNVKLDEHGQQTDSRKALTVYLVALNALRERYEGVERVVHHVRQLVNCADAFNVLQSPGREVRRPENELPSSNSHTADVITSSPQFFLRSMITVQLALARGEYPENDELPSQLASPADTDAENTCTCVSNEIWDLPELGDFPVITGVATPEDCTPDAYPGGAGMFRNLDSLASFDDFFEFFHTAGP
ncbi:hypothetical protein ABEF92_002349 [Exophiala dermatitidis]|uniref:Xylanolytic transcriptional activator regulatory domain-containing protein n=2 Tax=Exophiala dermatitidis TaxID=5970 RepID=H6C2P9_EXODN|nr:uncharacterized protein HMPREF1120_05987 [Exophiala dermatitidis NIH/UT8656]EHY57967.1 hypothetical protein HMPREF1120_05987 [Exophiala dermatitidis NIH/UT8656]